MTVEACDPFKLQVSKNPLGLVDIPVFVDARPHTWMLDPTAPFNMIARSLAREAGLKISEAAATIHTLTGRPMVVHMTVIPRFTLGGRLTFHQMTAFVFDDADYAFPRSHYEVEGGARVSRAGSFGEPDDHRRCTIEVRPAKQIQAEEKTVPAGAGQAETGQAAAGARFFLDGDRVIVALGRDFEERMFAIDAGGQQTYLTSRYYDEHANDFANLKMQLFTLPGLAVAASATGVCGRDGAAGGGGNDGERALCAGADAAAGLGGAGRCVRRAGDRRAGSVTGVYVRLSDDAV